MTRLKIVHTSLLKTGSKLWNLRLRESTMKILRRLKLLLLFNYYYRFSITFASDTQILLSL